MTISTFILAVALVESGNNPSAVGKHGELSEYQITRQVWESYVGDAFNKKNARKANVSNYVATRHAHKLEEKARRLMFEVYLWGGGEREIVQLCAAGWHRGEAYMKRPVSRWSAETRGYADRVWNVYQDLQRKNTLPPAR